MPENDDPTTSLRKAIRELGDAQKYLLRAGKAELVAEAVVLKEKARDALAAQPEETRCWECQQGLHLDCARPVAICGCVNQFHADPR